MAKDKLPAKNKCCGDSPDERCNGDNRRKESDRRASVVEQRVGLDRRRSAGRRRSETRRAAEEGEMTDEQFEFLMAINRYKSDNNRLFPTWTEVLDVTHAIGYRKVAKPEDIK